MIEYDFDGSYDLYKDILNDMPETIFDITPFHTRNGIKIQAYVKLDRKTIGEGTSVNIGAEEGLTIALLTAGKTNVLKTTNMLAGSMYSITFDMQSISRDDIYRSMQGISAVSEEKPLRETYSSESLGAYLSSIGKMYMSQADIAKITYADKYNVHTERYLSVCVTAFNLEMKTNTIGELIVNERGTISLDAKSDSYTAVPLDNSPDSVNLFYLNTGIRSSYLESDVLETATKTECVSTMKLFDIAKENNIEIISIKKSDADYSDKINKLKNNGISLFVLNEINENINSGYEVIIPVQNIEVNSWVGTGYIVAADGIYGFMLSNGTNGGEMTIPLDEWASRGEGIFKACYYLAFILGAIACLTSGATLYAVLFAVEEIVLQDAVVAAIFFMGSFISAFDSYKDLQSYNNEEKTSADKFTSLGNTIVDIFIIFGENYVLI